MGVLNVTPRRTVGISGFDVGRVTPAKFGMRGLGQGDSGTDATLSVFPTDTTPATGFNFPTYDAAPDTTPGPNYIDSITGQLVNGATGQVIGNPTPAQLAAAGTSTIGSSLTSLLSQLIGAGTKIGSQALTQANCPAGYTANAAGVCAPPAGTLTSSSLVPIALLLGGGLLLVMALKK